MNLEALSHMLYENTMAVLITGFIALVLFLFLLQRMMHMRRLLKQVNADVAQQVAEAHKQLQTEQRALEVAAKEQILQARQGIEQELEKQRSEAEQTRRRLEQREDTLDKRQAELAELSKELTADQEHLAEQQQQVGQAIDEQIEELERIGTLSRGEARQELLHRANEELRQERLQLIQRSQQQAEEEAERMARNTIAQAIQRCAVDHTNETTLSVVQLPNDDMKGRIIGREGRNIRHFEQLTGVDLIVDDTPEAVVLSAFDPVRREVARIALEHLIQDGRIHPGRIEEMVEKARQTIEGRIREAGEAATLETGVTGIHPEIIRLLGKLQFRTSFGQNVLRHSIEVSHLAGAMAGEIGARVAIARRAGLLHDLGKAVDFEREGTHAQISAEITRTHGEREEVVHAVAAHHGEVELESVEAALVQAGDAISASRPGARRETLDNYLKRLESLETIAMGFEGVEKVYAIHAGREIRVLVKPEQIDDLVAYELARDMASRIEQEMDYPGEIRVTVIRETRAVEYAK